MKLNLEKYIEEPEEIRLLYVNEHTSCRKYMKSVDAGFYSEKLSKGDIINKKKSNNNTIIFLLEGEFMIDYHIFRNNHIKQGNMLVIPKNSYYSLRILKDTYIIYLSFLDIDTLCEKQVLESYWTICRDMDYEFKPLEIRTPIKSFLENMNFCLNQGINCEYFHIIKYQEFFFYLRYFYTKEEISMLLYSIIGCSINFKTFVTKNWQEYMSLDDIVEFSGISKSVFIKRFKDEFGITPYQWKIQQKCQNIIYKATEVGTTVKDLMDEAEIYDASQFNRFCREYFNSTPKPFLAKYQNNL